MTNGGGRTASRFLILSPVLAVITRAAYVCVGDGQVTGTARHPGAQALVLGMSFLTVACGTTAVDGSATPSAPTASPSRQADPSAGPSEPSASAAPSAPATGASGYAMGMTIQVVADEVRVREDPGTGADIVAAMGRDSRASVIGGPAESDGYTWYEIQGTDGEGWVATGDAENRWIVAAPPVEPADLAFRFRSMCDATPPLVPPTLTITADRDVVVASPEDGRLQAGRLTPEAFADFMEVLDHPALAQSADYRPEPRPDAGEPPGHGLCIFEFTLGPPSDRVRVASVSWFGDEEESTYYLPAPERQALDELARGVMLGTDLFPSASWEVRPTDYDAAAFLVWIWSEAASPTNGVPTLEDLEVLGDPTAFGEAINSGRCGYLEGAAVEVMADAFAGTPSTLTLNAVSYLTAQTESGWVNIVTSPITPDGFPTCGDIPG